LIAHTPTFPTSEPLSDEEVEHTRDDHKEDQLSQLLDWSVDRLSQLLDLPVEQLEALLSPNSTLVEESLEDDIPSLPSIPHLPLNEHHGLDLLADACMSAALNGIAEDVEMSDNV
jgi:hypothetical protein